jgi:paraquat-inducible protein B
MKSKVSPTAIGIFIAGAIVILFASVILFGSGTLFRQTKTMLLTFREPTTGLEVGAPVKLLGVDIGTVSDVSLSIGGTNNSVLINVLIDLDREQISDVFGSTTIHLDDRNVFQKTIQESGLRGRLDVLSMLSGQLYIALDFHPGEPGFQLDREDDHGYWEIPTLPSTKREMMQSLVTSLQNFTELDFKGLSSELKSLLGDLRSDLARINIGQINTNLVDILDETKSLLANPELSAAITNLNQTLGQLDQLAEKLNQNINPLLADVDADLKKAGVMLDEGIQALRALKTQVEPSGTLSRELVRTLDEAGVALNALRQLLEQIERNPNSLITGKKEPKS